MQSTLQLRGLLLTLLTLAWCSLPLPAQFFNDFNSGLPAGTHVYGTAVAEDDAAGNGVIKLTVPVGNQNGSFVIDELLPGQEVTHFRASFLIRIDQATARPADGISFNFAADLPDGIFTPAVGFGSEDGGGRGLTVSMDTWDNNAPDTAPSIDLIYNGVVIATQSLDGEREGGRATTTPLITDPATGAPLNAWTAQPPTAEGGYEPMVVNLDSDGTVDVDWKGVRVFDNVPTGFVPTAGRFGFGARTGGAWANHFIDDLRIDTFNAGPPSILTQPQSITVGQGFTATFSVAVDGTPPYTFTWRKNGVAISGANGASYTTPPTTTADDGATFTVTIGNSLGEVDSAPAILTVTGDANPPEVVSIVPSPSGDQIFIQFNELLNPEDDSNSPNFNPGFDPFAYFITETANTGAILGVLAAAPGAGGRTIILTTDIQTPDTDYTVSMSDIQDVAGNGMPFTEVIFHSFVTGVGIFFADFNTGLVPGTSVTGTAMRSDTGGIDNSGSMQLVTATASQQGSYLVGDFSDNQPINQFTATMDILIGGAGQTGRPADGFSFNFGTDVAGNFGEEGVGSGLRVTLDTWDNDANDTAPSIEVTFGGTRLAAQAMDGVRDGLPDIGPFITDPATGSPMTLNTGNTPDSYTKLIIQLYADKTLDVTFKNVKIFDHLPIPYNTPYVAPTFGFGARTGNAWADHFIDNLLITTFTTGPAVITDQPDSVTVTQGFTATFSVGGDGTPPLSFQWKVNGVDIPGATSASYTTERTTPDMNEDVYTVLVSNPLGQELSAEAVLTVIPDGTPPVIAKATGEGSFTKVIVTFNEPVEDAADPFNYTVTGPGGDLSVTSATAKGNNAIVLVVGGLQENTVYTVTTSGMKDYAGNVVPEASPTSATFRSFVVSPGFVRREFYTGRGGVLVSDLLTDPNYPDNPSSSNFHNLLEGPLDVMDNYGIRITGFIVPAVSGAYDFFMSSDDQGEFMMSTDSNPANLRLICAEPIWNGSRDWQGTTRRNATAPENRSTTLFPDGLDMVAGQRYYFQALMKEAGGGDNVGVAWTPHGAPLPANGSSPITGAYLAVAADPAGVGVGFTQQPVSLTVYENEAATFTASAAAEKVYSTEFTSAPAGATIYNNNGGGVSSGRVADGYLHLTDAVNSQNNSFIINDFNGGQPVTAFTATFKVSLRDSTCCTSGPDPRPADGFSLNFGNLPNGPFGAGEEGTADGLVISFDTWDNDGNDSAPAISVRYNNVEKGYVSMGEPNPSGTLTTPIPTDPATGQPMKLTTGNQFVNVAVTLHPDGTVDVSYKDVQVLTGVQSGYTPRTGRFGFGARTGGANETHWIDDLTIAATSSSPAPFIQWQKDGVNIPGATGNSYTLALPQLTDNGSVYRAVASVPGASAVSDEATLTVLPDATPPVIASVRSDDSLTKVYVVYNELVQDADAAAAGHYSISDLSVTDAAKDTRDPSGKTYVLTTTPQTPGSAYIVTASNIRDLRNNNAASLTATFVAHVTIPGFEPTQELYFNIGGVNVSDLTGNPKFPNFPDQRSVVTLLEGPLDQYDNYGTRITGFLRPPASGPYNFFMSSDDGGEFWLSTDANPANKQRIAREPVWNGTRDYLGTARRNAGAPENRSSTLFPGGINLVAGNLYYFELLAKEGGGGDNCSVAWQLPGGPVPANGSSPIGGEYLAVGIDPSAISITITEQPQDQAVPFGCDDQPIIWASDFTSAPAGATIYNNNGGGVSSGRVADGFLHINDAVNSQNNSYVIEDFTGGQDVESFTARFKVSLRDSTCCSPQRPADGFAFNFGTLPNGVIGFNGEEGTPDGLVISCDTWDNNDGTDSDPSISVKYNNVEKGFVSMGEFINAQPGGGPTTAIPTDPATGLPMLLTTGPQFVDMEIKLYNNGKVDVHYKGVKVLDGVNSGYVPRTGRFGFTGRTGGANETHWVDDLIIAVNDDKSLAAPELVDVTQPGDPLLQVDGVNDGDTSSGAPPTNEAPPRAIDNTTQKYLNFLDLGSGFIVTPSMGLTTVSAIRLYTANDAIPRDPASYLLEGSISGAGGPWTPISSGPLALPDGRNPGGLPLDPATQFNQQVSFANTTPYTSYRVTFPTLKDAAAANSMQIGEVELLGVKSSGSFSTDFTSQPAIATIYNNAGGGVSSGRVADGYLHITDAVNSQNNSVVFADFNGGENVDSFTARFKVKIKDSTCCDPGLPTARPADGMTFNFGTLPDSVPNFDGEEGTANGLVVSFDTWDSSATDSDAAISVKYNGVEKGAVAMGEYSPNGGTRPPFVTDPATGQPMTITTGDVWADALVKLYKNGKVDVSYKGVRILAGVDTGYVPRSGRFGFAARTGGANETHWVDDLSIVLNDDTGATGGGTLLDETFDSGDGGFTVQNGIGANPTVGAEGFNYSAATGSWGANGGTGVKNSTLNSPVITVPGSGQVSLSFDHRYFFEDDGPAGRRWDGGAVYVSKNGGPYTYVDAIAFSANGYPMPRVITGNSPPLNGLFAFNGKSAGYDAGTHITSVASLGLFNGGDTLSVRFWGAWDEGYVEPGVDWEIAAVRLGFVEALPATFNVTAHGSIDGATVPTKIQWQRSDAGGSFANITGATSASLVVPATPADNGARFRAVLSIPGLTANSDSAELISSQAPHIVITEPADGSILFAGSTVQVRAMAMDPDGEVVQVVFYAGGIGAIGVDNNGADGWGIVVPNAPQGLYVLTAVATDNTGISCDSPPVVVTVRPNDPPVCSDVETNTVEDMPIIIHLSGMDPNGDPITFTAGQGAHGSVSVSGSTATYTPDPDYCGDDSFMFHATDALGASSGDCTVTVHVACVNDPPVCHDVIVVTDEDVPATIILDVTDVDGPSLIYVYTSPSHGTLSGTAPNLLYTPNADYNGSDSFTFSASDGQYSTGPCNVNITIRPVNDAPRVVIEVSPTRDLGSSVAGITMVSANNVNVCAVLDGSGTYDVEGDTIVSYQWSVDGVPVGDGPIIDACLLVGARTITLEASDGQDTGTGSVAVDVLTGGEAIEELVMVVDDSVVERKNKRPFIATLKTAAAGFDRGSVGSALNRLQDAFQNKVRAQIAKDNPDDADEWIRIAQEIIDAYAEPQDCEACQE